jgi:hypothetical protein
VLLCSKYGSTGGDIMEREKHGMCGTRLYRTWANMKRRIDKPTERDGNNYKSLEYCEAWSKFTPFMEWAVNNGYEDNLSLERIDVYKGYSPENCKWIPIGEQQYNKTTTHRITYNGKTQALSKWAKELGFERDTLKSRILRGWDIERAFTEPLGIGRIHAANIRRSNENGRFV